MRNPGAGASVVIAAALACSACGPGPGTPEEQVRAWVIAMESAAEEEAHGTIMELIAPSYNDARGNARDDVDTLLRFYFLRQDPIGLLSSIDDISVDGGTAAQVTLTVGMAGTNDNVLGFRADAYRFELELEAQGQPESYEDWRLLSARWAEMGEPLR